MGMLVVLILVFTSLAVTEAGAGTPDTESQPVIHDLPTEPIHIDDLAQVLRKFEEPPTPDIRGAVIEGTRWIVGVRQKLHQFPELGFKEVDTSKTLRMHMDQMGIKYKCALLRPLQAE